MLLFSVISPLTISISPEDDTSYIVTLDVCNTSSGALSVNNESPVIQECPYSLAVPAFIGYVSIPHLEHLPQIFTSREDRPPKT
jgi:hypothetical protein